MRQKLQQETHCPVSARSERYVRDVTIYFFLLLSLLFPLPLLLLLLLLLLLSRCSPPLSIFVGRIIPRRKQLHRRMKYFPTCLPLLPVAPAAPTGIPLKTFHENRPERKRQRFFSGICVCVGIFSVLFFKEGKGVNSGVITPNARGVSYRERV